MMGGMDKAYGLWFCIRSEMLFPLTITIVIVLPCFDSVLFLPLSRWRGLGGLVDP